MEVEGGGWRRTGKTQRKEEEQPAKEEDVAESKGDIVEEAHDEKEKEEEVLHGVASIALFPSGSLSGHFLDTVSSACFGLFGTEIACERECSRGEDYRLLNLTVINFKTKKETAVVVERKGEDAARLSTTCDLHGWDEEVVEEAKRRHRSGDTSPTITFECETLKADTEAEEHLQKFMPSLVGRDAVVNVGPMTITGLSANDLKGGGLSAPVTPRAAAPKRTLEETLRLVFGDVGHAAVFSSQQKRQLLSSSNVEQHSEVLQGFVTRSSLTACDLDDDF